MECPEPPRNSKITGSGVLSLIFADPWLKQNKFEGSCTGHIFAPQWALAGYLISPYIVTFRIGLSLHHP